MADEVQEVKAEVVQPKPDQVSLVDLMKLAQPLIQLYTDAQLAQRREELAHEMNALQILSRQNSILIIGFFIVALVVLGIASYLYVQGRDNSATNLIQLVVALGGAAFGGYGWARSRRLTTEEEK